MALTRSPLTAIRQKPGITPRPAPAPPGVAPPAPAAEPAPTPTPSSPPAAPAADAERQPGPGELITPAAAAERLTVSAKVLERWRGTGAGPAYVRLSSKTIRYRPGDIDAFVAGRARASTAVA